MILSSPQIEPLGNIISTCEWDIDSTIYDTYSGSGQNVNNINPSPNSGTSQASYDLYRGADGTSTTDDPTFSGTAGDSGAKFTLDGGDYFKLQGANPSFVDNWHDSTAAQDWTFIMAFTYTAGVATSLASTKSGGLTHGILLYTLAANNYIYITQRGTGGADTKNSAVALSNGVNIIGISHSFSTNNTRFFINSTTPIDVAQTFTSGSTAANDSFTLFAYGDGGVIAPSGTEFKACSAFNQYADAELFGAVAEQYGARHNTTYI